MATTKNLVSVKSGYPLTVEKQAEKITFKTFKSRTEYERTVWHDENGRLFVKLNGSWWMLSRLCGEWLTVDQFREDADTTEAIIRDMAEANAEAQSLIAELDAEDAEQAPAAYDGFDAYHAIIKTTDTERTIILHSDEVPLEYALACHEMDSDGAYLMTEAQAQGWGQWLVREERIERALVNADAATYNAVLDIQSCKVDWDEAQMRICELLGIRYEMATSCAPLDEMEQTDSEEFCEEYGADFAEGTTVYSCEWVFDGERRSVIVGNDGGTYSDAGDWYCEYSEDCSAVGQAWGKTPEEALLAAFVDAKVYAAMRSEGNCEDSVNVAAYTAWETMHCKPWSCDEMQEHLGELDAMMGIARRMVEEHCSSFGFEWEEF